MTLTYESSSAAREHFKDILDAAEDGRLVAVYREGRQSAVVSADRLRYFLAGVLPRAAVVPEDGGWSIFIPGSFVAADGASFDVAVDEMVEALREYAEDWQDHLLRASDHQDQWGLVQFVSLSDDGQLRDWLISEPA